MLSQQTLTMDDRYVFKDLLDTSSIPARIEETQSIHKKPYKITVDLREDQKNS